MPIQFVFNTIVAAHTGDDCDAVAHPFMSVIRVTRNSHGFKEDQLELHLTPMWMTSKDPEQLSALEVRSRSVSSKQTVQVTSLSLLGVSCLCYDENHFLPSSARLSARNRM